MANINSTAIANRNATPRVRNNVNIGPAFLLSQVATVEVSTATDANDLIRFFEVPSSASPRALKVWSDAAITAGAVNIGLYRTTGDGGAVVDADLFASAVAVGGGLTGADQMFESGVIDEGDMGQALWELLGLDADPNIMYDLVAQVTTDMQVAGTITVELQYTDTN